jgi:hypothetical protein
VAQAFLLALSEAEGPVRLALSAFFHVALVFQASLLGFPPTFSPEKLNVSRTFRS